MFGWMLAAVVERGLAPNAPPDLVTAGGVQVAAFLVACAIFAARRPGRSWSDLFALRRTPVLLLLAALLLGVALCPPAERLALFVHELFPLPKELLAEQEAMLRPRSPLHGALLLMVGALAGPFAEELFFRGAIFTALRPHATTIAAAGTTALLFTLIHPEPRTWAPILALACVLGYVRVVSGSLWPSLFLHAGFNGTALIAEFRTAGGDGEFSASLVVGGTVLSVLLLGGVWLAGRSQRVQAVRELDQGVPS